MQQPFCKPNSIFFVFVYTNLTVPHKGRKPDNGVLGDEPCRLNGTAQALGEPVEVNHLRRTIHRVPGGSHSPRPTRRLNPPTSAVGLTSSGCQTEIHFRHPISEDFVVPDKPGAAPRTWFGNPYLNRYGAHSKHMPQASMLYWVAKSSRASLMPSRGACDC